MAWRGFLFLSFFLTGFVLEARGAVESGDSRRANPEYVLKFWRTEDGLPQNSITAITQSADGYIWFGTRHGLVQFDGVRFRVYNAVNTPELGSSHVTALEEDGAGRLWIGLGGGGLAVRDGEEVQRVAGLDQEGEREIRCLLARRDELWVGTSGGLRKWSGGADGRWMAVTRALSGAPVYALEEDADGVVWVGTASGLFRCEGKRMEAVAPRSQAIHSVLAGAEGRLWIGGGSFGLLELRAGEQTPRRVWPVNEFLALGKSAKGGLWVVKPGGAVEKLTPGTLSTTPLLVTVENVTELFEDREGNLWIGTEGNGLAQLRRKRLVLHTPERGGQGVVSVTEGARGGLWLAGESGRVFRLGVEGMERFPAADEATGGFCETLWASRRGGVWFGTRLNGLFYWDGTEPVRLRQISGSAGIRALFEDRQGRIWVASEEEGVLVCEEGAARVVKGPDGEALREVTCFAEDLEGRMWIGTRRGLVEWSEHSVRWQAGKGGVAEGEILSLYQDLEGNLWIGTTRGLGLRRNERFYAVTSRDGLYDDVIHQIVEDFRQQLWVGSNRGIFRVGKDELHDFFAGKIWAVQCVPYGSEEGVGNPEGVGGRQPTAWRGTDGTLWFATSEGVAALDAAGQGARAAGPPVIIEEITVEDGRVTEGGEDGSGKLIPAGYGRMHIRFTALSFVAPERTHFRYRLAGYEEEWHQGGTERTATYAHVPAGEYNFQVVARNEDGGWKDSGASVGLIIEPQYWETGWFRVLVGVVLASGAGFVWLAQSARAREVRMLRQQITRDLHDDMGSNLGSIALLSDALREGARSGAGQIEDIAGEIHRIARETLEAMGEAVWFVNPEKDSSADLLAHMRQIAGRMLRGMPHRFTAPERAGEFRLALDRKRAVVLIFKEALHNIIRHSGATEVEIEVRVERNTLHLRVRDNGRGFDPAESGNENGNRPGHGLRNMRQRAKKMRADLALESAPGKGAELRLTLNCS